MYTYIHAVVIRIFVLTRQYMRRLIITTTSMPFMNNNYADMSRQVNRVIIIIQAIYGPVMLYLDSTKNTFWESESTANDQ